MYSMSDLRVEIQKMIDDADARGVPQLNPRWMTAAIIASHPKIEGGDADFYTTMAHEAVASAVRDVMNGYKLKPSLATDEQIRLPGFERLQKRYIVSVAGEQIAVRVQDLTSAQRAQKIVELRKMGDGCHQHADELERFGTLLSVAAE